MKPVKKDRLVFDGSAMLTWDSLPVNYMTQLFHEPEIIFNQIWSKHLSRIWNLHITYLQVGILLFDDDVAGTFCTVKKNLDIAAVFSFLIEGTHPHDVGTLLDQQGIAVRTGHHCAMPVMEQFKIPGTVRASFTFYNTLEEVDALFKAIEKVKMFLL